MVRNIIAKNLKVSEKFRSLRYQIYYNSDQRHNTGKNNSSLGIGISFHGALLCILIARLNEFIFHEVFDGHIDSLKYVIKCFGWHFDAYNKTFFLGMH